MKINRKPLLTLAIALGAMILSACSGSASAATSWPGVSVDPDRNLAYVAYTNFIYAVDIENGTEKWRFPDKADNKMTFFAPPTLTEDGQLLVGSYNHLLYSLDPETGKVNQSNWPFQAGNRLIAAPLVTPEGIFVPSADEYLYALDSSGNMRWKFRAQQALWATPVANGSAVYLPSMDHHLYALDAQNGNLLWKTDDLGGALVGQPALSPDGVLFFGTFASEMLAVDVKKGSILWRTPTSGWVWAGPALDEGTLYFGDLQGKFYALNAADGSEKWSRSPEVAGPDQAIPDRPVILDATVYFSSENGTLYALDKTNGNPRWRTTFEGKLYAAPVAANGKLFVAPVGTDALLVAVDTSGNQVWNFVPQK